MNDHARYLQARIESLRARIETLSSIRELVSLPPELDISERQWIVLNSELAAVESSLLRRLKRVSRDYLAQVNSPKIARVLNAELGQIELELSRAFTFFDTYMDVLTQRHAP